MDNKGKGIDTTPTHRWSALNNEILRKIFSKLRHSNIYECGAVCTPWGAAVRAMYSQFLLLSNVDVCRDEDGELHYKEFTNYNRFSNKSFYVLFNPVSLQ
ncbi:hypothetical protein Q3G72_025337 [Acer saccharum]|nr:hypothetical protein Q3G72_025337 [Acer saccharum]